MLEQALGIVYSLSETSLKFSDVLAYANLSNSLKFNKEIKVKKDSSISLIVIL